VWVGEVDGDPGVDRQLGVLSEFLAAVPGQRLPQLPTLPIDGTAPISASRSP
jgi:hypothetical protein